MCFVPSTYAHAFASMSSVVVNGTTFTNTSSPTLSVASSTSLSATSTLAFSLSTSTWSSIGWRIATNSGAFTCAVTPSVSAKSGSVAEPFSLTTPAVNGTYNLYIAAYSTNTCSGAAIATLTKTNAIQIGPLPDLTIALTNNVSGATTVGHPFTWTLLVQNADATSTFATSNTIMTDDLPTGATYGTPVDVESAGTTGSVNCSISGTTAKSLSCTASGSVAIPAGGTITVSIPVTPTTATTLNNPRVGGINGCKVDPQNRIAESNSTNNACADSVVVSAPVVSIDPSTLPAATTGATYDQLLTASTTATGTFVWSVTAGTLPAGLSLSTTTGLTTHLVGTATTTGTSTFSLKVSNGTSSTTQAYSLVVSPAVSVPTSVSVQNAPAVFAQNIAININNQLLGGFLTNITGESIAVQSLKVHFISTVAAAALQNISIVDENGTVVAGPFNATLDVGASGMSQTVEFLGPMLLTTGSHTYTIKGLVANDTPNNTYFQAWTNPSVDWTGVTGHTTGSPVAMSVGSIYMNAMMAQGPALTATYASTPVSQNIVAGSSNVEFANILLDATQSSEAVRVPSLPMQLFETGSGQLGSCQAWSGTTTLSTGANIVSPSSGGNVTFVFDSPLIIPKGSIISVSIRCTVASGVSGVRRLDVLTPNFSVVGDVSGNFVGVVPPSNTAPTMYIVPGGTLTAITDPAAPIYSIVAGGTTGVTANIIQLRASSEAVNLQRLGLKLTSGSATDISQVYIYAGSNVLTTAGASVAPGTLLGTAIFTGATQYATSTLLTPVQIQISASTTLIVKADFNQIGVYQPATEGDLVAIDYDDAQGVGVTSGAAIFAMPIVNFVGVSGDRMFRSFPVVTPVSGLGSTGVSDGNLLRFAVTANIAGPVNLAQMVFSVVSNGASVSNMSLLAFTDSGYSIPVTGTVGGIVGVTAVVGAYATTTIATPLQVPGGSPIYFQLRGVVAPTSPIYAVTTTLLGDTSFAGMGQVSNLAASNFVWSPNATSTSQTTNNDWTNGAGIVKNISQIRTDTTSITTPSVPQITITPTTLQSSSVGVTYTQSLVASTTASGPFTWSVVSGMLPDGVTLGSSTSNTDTLVGTTTTATTSTFAIEVTNGVSSTTQSYSITVTPPVSTTPPPVQSCAVSNLVTNCNFLVANGSVPQSWTTAGYGTNTRVFTYATSTTASSSPVGITISSYTDGDAKWLMSPVAVTPGHIYTYTDVYQSNVPTQLVVEYTNASSTVTFANFTAVPAIANSGWGTSTVSFIPPTGTVSVRVYHSIYSIGSLLLDSVSLSDVTAPQAANNLIANASLDNANLTNPNLPLSWTTGNYGSASTTFTYPVVGQTGSAAKVANTTYTSGDAKWVMSPVAVTPGRTYTYSDAYLSNTPTQISVEYTDASSTVSYGNFLTVPASTDLSTWSTASTTFIVPANVVSVRVYHALASVGQLTLDNTSLVDTTPVPTITIVPSVIQSGAINVPYTQTLTASTTVAGPFTWSINSGSLPSGFALSTSTTNTATITGSTTATSTNTFVVTVTNGSVSATKQYTITVFPSIMTTGTVTVVTNVVNTHGGTDTPADFNISASGASSTPTYFVGSGAGTKVTVSANTNYGITTVTGLYYSVAYSPDCTGMLAGGDAVTCTITLSDIQPLLPGQPTPNLIQNPGLETASPASSTLPQYWTPSVYGTNATVFSYVAASSTNDEITPSGMIGTIAMSSYVSGDAKWVFNSVPVTPGHSYKYTDIYLANVPTTLTVAFTHTDNTVTFGGFITVPASPASTTWEQSSTGFTVPSDVNSVTVYHALGSVGSLSIDNASLTEVVQPISFDQGFVTLSFDDGLESQFQNAVPLLDAAHLKGSFYIITHTAGMAVANPTLDTPDAASSTLPKGWQTSGSTNATFKYPVAGQSGSAAEVFSAVAGSNAAWYLDPVTVLPDENYTYSDSYRSGTTSDIVIQMTDASGTLEYINTAGSAVTTKVAALTLASTSNAWVTLPPLSFYIPPNIKTVTVLHRLAGAGTLDVDNISFGDYPTYMTPAQVLQMQADGQEIGGHTQIHPDLATLSNADQTTQIAGSRQDLLDNGVSSVTTFVYPYGSYNTATEQIDKQAGYIAARSLLPGFNGRNSDIYALLSQSVDTDTTLAQVESWIDQAKANKQWLILVFHPVQADLTGQAYGTTPQLFQGITNYLNTNSVPVLTMAQGAVLMGAPKLAVSVVVNNTHGATSTPADFTVNITGASASPSTFPGSATTTMVSIQPQQQYSVALQSVPSYYTVATSTNCAGSQLQGTTVSCVVTLSDIAVNHAPVATDSATTTVQDTATPVTLSATDVDHDPLTYTIVSAPTHGTLSGTSSVETYLPTTGFTGTDTFTFKANDGKLDSNVATVTVTVQPVVVTSTSSNLILNPSFTTANPTDATLPLNWSHGGWGTNTAVFTYPVAGHTDAKAAQVQITSYTDGDAKWVFDPVAVTPSHTYTYTDAYESNIASQLVVEYQSTTNTYSYANYTTIPASASWGTATVTFTVPVGTASVRVFHLLAGVGSLTIDDASVSDQAGSGSTTPPVPTIIVTPSVIANGVIGQSYTQTLTANTTATGPFTWSLATGSLPPGLTLSASTNNVAIISGIPTTAGTWSSTVKVTNGTSSTTQSYTVTVGAAATSTPNLILNPSFTTANPTDATLPLNWSHGGWGTNTAVFTYPVAGHTDAKAAQVQITSYTDGDAKWVFDPVAVTPSHTYTYTDAYESNIASQLVVEYQSTTNTYSYANYTTIPASASWGTATVTFTVPVGTASVRVFHLLAGVGSLTIDDASLTDGQPAAAPATSLNIVANPLFAVPNTTNPSLPQNWSQDAWGTNTAVFTYPVAGNTDSTAAQVQVTSYTDGDAKWSMDPVPVTAGASYTYTDAYLADVPSHIEVEFLDATGAVVSFAGDTIVPASNPAWGVGTVTFTPPAGAVSAQVVHYLTSVGSLTLDTVSIVSN